MRKILIWQITQKIMCIITLIFLCSLVLNCYSFKKNFRESKSKKILSGLFERMKSISLSPFHYLESYIFLPLYSVLSIWIACHRLSVPLCTVVFNTAISWEVAKSSTKRSHTPFTQLSLIVTPAVISVQQQNQEIYIGTIHRLYSNTYLYFCMYTVLCICNFIVCAFI